MLYHLLGIVALLRWPITVADGTLISNVNLVFETFNPVSMVRFFEFNDKGWNISAGCIQDMFHYLDGLHRDVGWAMRREYGLLQCAFASPLEQIPNQETRVRCAYTQTLTNKSIKSSCECERKQAHLICADFFRWCWFGFGQSQSVFWCIHVECFVE